MQGGLVSDLRSQLAARFPGAAPSETTPAPAEEPAPGRPDLLDEFAHLDTPWLAALRKALSALDKTAALGPRPKLAHAQQLTAQAMRELKALERKGQARELAELRDDFLARREKAAWAALKLRFHERALPEKAYRSIKQEGLDPVAALQRLQAVPADELQGIGAARLKALLQP